MGEVRQVQPAQRRNFTNGVMNVLISLHAGAFTLTWVGL